MHIAFFLPFYNSFPSQSFSNESCVNIAYNMRLINSEIALAKNCIFLPLAMKIAWIVCVSAALSTGYILLISFILPAPTAKQLLQQLQIQNAKIKCSSHQPAVQQVYQFKQKKKTMRKTNTSNDKSWTISIAWLTVANGGMCVQRSHTPKGQTLYTHQYKLKPAWLYTASKCYLTVFIYHES